MAETTQPAFQEPNPTGAPRGPEGVGFGGNPDVFGEPGVPAGDRLGSAIDDITAALDANAAAAGAEGQPASDQPPAGEQPSLTSLAARASVERITNGRVSAETRTALGDMAAQRVVEWAGSRGWVKPENAKKNTRRVKAVGSTILGIVRDAHEASKGTPTVPEPSGTSRSGRPKTPHPTPPKAAPTSNGGRPLKGTWRGVGEASADLWRARQKAAETPTDRFIKKVNRASRAMSNSVLAGEVRTADGRRVTAQSMLRDRRAKRR